MRSLLCLLALLALAIDVSAGGRRGGGQPMQQMQGGCPGGVCSPSGWRNEGTETTTPPNSTYSVAVPVYSGETRNMLAEVNALRAQRRMAAYLPDPNLQAAAEAAAAYRAKYDIQGHVRGGGGDFAFLPQGSWASCAGCAAWPPGMGFGACNIYGGERYCGAASCMGKNGVVYHHAFYR